MGSRIRRGDLVVLVTGDDRELDKKAPSPRRVLRVYPKRGKVVVEGANLVWKHVRRSQKHPRGGRIQKEMPLDLSNVMLFCEKCRRPVRVGFRAGGDGNRERFCKKCGVVIPTRA